MKKKTFRLGRTVQCKLCPWRVNTDPNLIPNGYSVENHKNLACTIADPNSQIITNKIQAMSCHEHSNDEQVYCIGWLYNQLGRGNNIALRIEFMHCENANEIKLNGKQHLTFKDTLPKE